MKNYSSLLILLVVWIAAFPFIAAKATTGSFVPPEETAAIVSTVPESPKTTLPTMEALKHEKQFDSREVTVNDTESNITEKITADTYAVRVMAAISRYDYKPEALKAQVIAIRTYAVYMAVNGKTINADSGSYITPEHLAGQTNTKTANKIFTAMEEAAESTSGIYAMYDGKYAQTLFHISSQTQTESYENYRYVKIPYLVSVKTPDESNTEGFDAKYEYSAEEFKKVLEENGYSFDLSANHREWVTDIVFNKSGRCKYIKISDSAIGGESFRRAFKINSTCLMIATTPTGFTISTEGIGHGVGLSICGSAIMAESGSTYEEILSHYYMGIEITH